MNKREIQSFLDAFEEKKYRTIVIIDYANVEKWKYSLKWDVGIRELAKFVKHLSVGKKYLRRCYYGSDYGNRKNTSKTYLLKNSKGIIQSIENNGFTLVTKSVKYIRNREANSGFIKKCDLDVEMVLDLIKEIEGYDQIILFSGDGDLMLAIKYLYNYFGKEAYVFGARNHIGREVFDARKEKYIKRLFFVEDFQYRLDSKRFYS